MSKLQPASFTKFERETERGNVVPVVRTVPAEARTPVDVFLRVGGNARYAFLFESVEGSERVARYSFIGAAPEMIVRGRRTETIIERNDKTEIRKAGPVDFARDYFSERKLARRDDLPPFAGGAVGYLGYGAARWFEPALAYDTHELLADDLVWMVYRRVLAFDRVRQQIDIISLVFTEEAGGSREALKDLYDRAVEDTAQTEKLLQADIPLALPDRTSPQHGSEVDSAFASNWAREGFEEAVRTVKEHILAGDCYQVVLSQRFTKTSRASPIAIYRALRAINPSPYLYFFRLGDEAIIGASPEMLVRCRGQQIDYRPIAGTRRRGATEEEDKRLGEEMRLDEKEVAEHMMLVDLGRNDVGRVADYGSVRVDDLMSIERYSHVQHLVSSVSARLRDGLSRFDALASCFPAGTVTGAPKVRAMELIRELEPEARGVYAGAVLYADYSDNLDSCIAIRTIVIRDGIASVQAGAGIVADSIPEREYEETVDKAQALFRAIAMAEKKSDQQRI